MLESWYREITTHIKQERPNWEEFAYNSLLTVITTVLLEGKGAVKGAKASVDGKGSSQPGGGIATGDESLPPSSPDGESTSLVRGRPNVGGRPKVGWDGRAVVKDATGKSINMDGKKYEFLGYDEKGSPVYQDAEVLREQTAKEKDSTGQDMTGAAEQSDIDRMGYKYTDEIKATQMESDSPIKDWDFSNMTTEEASDIIHKAVSNLQEQAEKMDYPYGLVFGHQANSAKVQVVKDSKLPFVYNHKEDVVYVNPFHSDFADYDFDEAMLHELAHRYDRTAVESWTSQSFSGALTKAKAHAISNLSMLEQIANRYPTDYYLQDIIGIISDGRVKAFAGHGQLSAESAGREVFANLASMRARNTETYDVLMRMFPEMIQEFENLFGGE